MKKGLKAVIAIIIIIGIVIIVTLGLRFDLMYRDHVTVDVNIGKDFEANDIKNIVKEIIGKDKEIIIQKVEIYQDIVSIGVESILEEQIEILNTKINEKYEIENKTEDIVVTNVAKYRGRDIIKPYILPVIISALVILVYMAVRYKKIGIGKVVLQTLGLTTLGQLLYLSLIAITRLPVMRLTMPISMIIYIAGMVIIACKFEKALQIHNEEEEKKKK